MSASADRSQIPYWKRAHHDWRFWVGMAVTFAAIAMYVMSDNLAYQPRI
jgi:hypothetical protein